jgi:hypothetical protein
LSAPVNIDLATSENVRRMVTSPTADSLYALAGAPRSAGEPRVPATATYEPAIDRVAMDRGFTSPEMPNYGANQTGEMYTPRMALAHELGHRYDWTKGQPSPALAVREQEADAFAKAFDLLSKTGTPKDTSAIEQRLADIEQKYPGTRDMIGRMLQSESQLFAGHPLQAALGTPAQRRKTANAPVIKGRMEDVLKNLIVPRDED